MCPSVGVAIEVGREEVDVVVDQLEVMIECRTLMADNARSFKATVSA